MIEETTISKMEILQVESGFYDILEKILMI